jgi:hypothetical protein
LSSVEQDKLREWLNERKKKQTLPGLPRLPGQL